MKPFDEQGRFQPSADGFRSLAVRGAWATLFSSGLGLTTQILATAVLARLLTPADFGVVTMVTTFSLLLVNFGLNGFTEAVLQRAEINHRLASNLFWINAGSGLLLTIGLATAGPLIARFFNDPRVTDAAAALAVPILISSISVLHLALLKRAMRFSKTSVADISSRAISLLAAIVLAWMGWGYWALVAAAIVQALTQTIMAWCFCRWIPCLPRRVPGTAEMIRFATQNYFSRNADNLLVGWRFSAAPLGFYKKAYDLFALSASQSVAPLTSVAVSALSRLQGNRAAFRRYFLNALGLIAFIGMAWAGVLTLTGADLIRLLLGSRWAPAGEILVFFGPGTGMMLVYYTNSWIHISTGRPDRWLRWGILEFAFTLFLFLLFLSKGPKGIALAWSLSFWFLTVPALWFAGRPIQLRITAVLAILWKYTAAFVVAGLVSAGIRDAWFPRQTPILAVDTGLRILEVSALYLLCYLGLVILLHRGLEPVRALAEIVREMFPRRAALARPARFEVAPDMPGAAAPGMARSVGTALAIETQHRTY